MTHTRRRTSAGFSLIEMLLVLFVLLVGTTLAVMQIQSVWPQYRANSAMDLAVSQLRIARQMAVAQRRNVQVAFLMPNQIQSSRQELPAGVLTVFPPVFFEGGAQFIQFGGLPDTPANFGNGGPIVFDGIIGGPPTMFFQPDGTFVNTTGQPINGTLFIGIPGKQDTARAVTLLGATGRVRAYHWVTTQWAE